MRTCVHKEPGTAERGRKLKQSLLLGLVLVIVAVAVLVQACGRGTSATTSGATTSSASSSSTSSTSGSSSSTVTLPGVSDADLQQDTASPAQAVVAAINPSVVNVAVTGVAPDSDRRAAVRRRRLGVIYTSDGLILRITTWYPKTVYRSKP